MALDAKVVVALAGEFAGAGGTLEQSLRQCDASRNAMLALLNECGVFVGVDVAIHLVSGHRMPILAKKEEKNKAKTYFFVDI